MTISLPVINQGKHIGLINRKTGKIDVSGAVPVKFSCLKSTDCCRDWDVPITEADVLRIQAHGVYKSITGLSVCLNRSSGLWQKLQTPHA